jgi:hypothetical protein
MAKAINMRPNKARTDLHSSFNGKFGEGKGMAETRKHPTDKQGAKSSHTTNDGTRA